MTRLTPAQVAVHLMCGRRVRRLPGTLEDRVQRGRRLLSELAGVDYGYDLQRWHDHLKVTRPGGYTWNRTVDLPRIMKQALASEEWRKTVASLTDDG